MSIFICITYILLINKKKILLTVSVGNVSYAHELVGLVCPTVIIMSSECSLVVDCLLSYWLAILVV